MKLFLVGTVSALALTAGAACASPSASSTVVSGYVDVSYAYTSGTLKDNYVYSYPGEGESSDVYFDNYKSSISSWSVGGAASLPVTNLVGAQVDLSYSNFRNSLHETWGTTGCSECEVGTDSYSVHGDGTVATGHIFARTDQWLAGAFVGTADYNTGRLLGGGVEGQYYAGRFTLQGSVGVATLKTGYYEGEGNGTFNPLFWSGRLDARYFVTDDLSLGVNTGYMDGSNSYAEDSYDHFSVRAPGLWTVGVSGEYQIPKSGVSLFVNYEHGGVTANSTWTYTGEGTEVETDKYSGSGDAVRVGFRWNIGETLFNRDRHGASLNSFQDMFGGEFLQDGAAVITGYGGGG